MSEIKEETKIKRIENYFLITIAEIDKKTGETISEFEYLTKIVATNCIIMESGPE